MPSVDRRQHDSKILFAVSALVVGGTVAIAVLAGLGSGHVSETTRSRSVAKATPTRTQRPASSPATFERTVPRTSLPAIDPDPVTEFVISPDENLVARGLEAFRGREFDRATAYFLAEAEARPERSWTHYMIGLSMWKSERMDEAVAAMEDAARLDPTSVRTRVNLSRIQNDRGEFAAALDAARAALELAPDDPAALFLEGRSLRNLGSPTEAMLSLERSRDLDPENGYVKNLLGLVYIGQSMTADAVATLRSAVELEPDVAYVHNNLGMALELDGQPFEALAAYRRALGCDPSHEHGMQNLARLETTLPTEEPWIVLEATVTEVEVDAAGETVLGTPAEETEVGSETASNLAN